ncbi:hypothetical protein Tdes44962_MAKER03671 [Teratosphaeria destructans]|uniref:Uncharacterized protein n=1 Tax=Teratosphaeria destructans TaxID=418781 RepID=A0A9W7SPE1_9PEZI|nr:hypothetical protein Tdes44962_MAKER03671 [Teratosphaeria destructans]
MDRGSLTAQYLCYKEGTDKLVGWLATEAQKCGGSNFAKLLPQLRDAKEAVRKAEKGRGADRSATTVLIETIIDRTSYDDEELAEIVTVCAIFGGYRSGEGKAQAFLNMFSQLNIQKPSKEALGAEPSDSKAGTEARRDQIEATKERIKIAVLVFLKDMCEARGFVGLVAKIAALQCRRQDARGIRQPAQRGSHARVDRADRI